MVKNKIKAKCSCCSGEVIVEYLPAKWQGEEDKVIIKHIKWQESYS